MNEIAINPASQMHSPHQPLVPKSDQEINGRILNESAQILEMHMLENISKEDLNSDNGPEKVAHLLSMYLPMPSGRGNDTICNQPQFIVNNKQLLKDFIQGIPRAIEVLEERDSIIK